MAKVKVILDRAGVEAGILKSPETQKLMGEIADKITGSAEAMTGLNYKNRVRLSSQRAWGQVTTDEPHAYYDNLKNNTLLKALRGTKV